MTSSAVEKAPQATDLAAQMQFAKALATATTLPKAYRGQPGDVLLAMEYGRALGLTSVATVMTSVHVIEGRPSMSAELMQALVRRAGHRIRVTGDNQSATCAIVRRDDPDFQYSATFTLEDAKRAGLLGKTGSNWSKYPAAMLLARATSACCRQACADVLAGVSYVPEELGEQEWAPSMGNGVTTTVTTQQPVTTVEADAGTPHEQTTQPTEADAEEARWREGWVTALDLAVEQRDLEEVQRLGQLATAHGAGDLRDDAISAWSDVQAALAADDA
jgi:hypothetical protein